MADNDKKPFVHVLPAILTGVAALIASLTAVYVNVRGDSKQHAPVAQVAEPAVVLAAPVEGQSVKPQLLRLKLDRIAVERNGAHFGNADWRFAVEADGQPLFVFEQDDLSSDGGRNVVLLGDHEPAQAMLELRPEHAIAITVKGWRSGLFKSGSKVAVQGQGMVSAQGAVPPVQVKGEKANGAAFVFYFSALPEDGK